MHLIPLLCQSFFFKCLQAQIENTANSLSIVWFGILLSDSVLEFILKII